MRSFHDDEGGGFFTTADDAEALIVRTKEIFDGATPSANAVAALALARLGALTGHPALHRIWPARWSTCSANCLSRHPTAFAQTVLTADLLVEGCTEVVVTGDRPDLWPRSAASGCPRPYWRWGEPTDSPAVGRPPR